MRENNYELLKEGHSTALVHIHSRYSRMVYWLGKGMISDDFVVESLLQDTFLKLWLNRDKIESEDHIFFFLRMVMKRECYSYYTSPKNKFFRKMNALESYENYQDYLAGYDPLQDTQILKDQQHNQEAFDKIKRALPLLSEKRKRLIDLCLKYGFRYKPIAQVMGISITETSKEVKKAIQELKNIINIDSTSEAKQQSIAEREARIEMTENQQKVLELRCVHKHSFASIAAELDLSKKEVHAVFTAAYKLMQEQHEVELQPA